MDLFEEATKLKLRFQSKVGWLTTEDLWDLPLKTTKTEKADLQEVALAVYQDLKVVDKQDFIGDSNTEDPVLSLKMDVVKHIIEFKKKENAAARDLAERRRKKEKILSIMAEKQDEKLKSASLEELQAQLDGL